jgi:hypothetical protein
MGLWSLLVAAAIWLPCLHIAFPSNAGRFRASEGLSPVARGLAARQLRLWTEPGLREAEIRRMRARNAEWDFMARSFLVWSLAELALRDPDLKQSALQAMDSIIDETLRLERQEGMYHFLMPYAQERPFVVEPPRSLFIDGEIALMLGCRRMLEEKQQYRLLMTERIAAMVERMRRSPVLSAESYPNECWTFCNAVALAAIKVSDHLDGTDHSQFCRQWVATAKEKLTDPTTGLLVSTYALHGQHLQGPEGSSIWMAAHCLRLVDEQFAADQYRRARAELARQALGFAYAREWPASRVGPPDVDSGPVVPVLGASAGSSGLAFVAAASFGDEPLLALLFRSLEFAGFPTADRQGLRFCASNQVGDAVLLYAAVLGPVWDRATGEARP